MEKVSFWDRLLGRRSAGQKNPEWVDSTESPPDGSLRGMISERRSIYEETKAEEERREEEDKQRRVAEACLNASNILEDFLASASENILESAEKGWHKLHVEIPLKDIPRNALENLKAFKALQTFCNKHGLKFDYSIAPKYGLPPPGMDYTGSQRYNESTHHRIEIVF